VVRVSTLPMLVRDRIKCGTDCRQHAQRISDVLCKLAPYLKLYSEYTSNYKKASKSYDELYAGNKRFSALVAEIEVTTSPTLYGVCSKNIFRLCQTVTTYL